MNKLACEKCGSAPFWPLAQVGDLCPLCHGDIAVVPILEPVQTEGGIRGWIDKTFGRSYQP